MYIINGNRLSLFVYLQIIISKANRPFRSRPQDDEKKEEIGLILVGLRGKKAKKRIHIELFPRIGARVSIERVGMLSSEAWKEEKNERRNTPRPARAFFTSRMRYTHRCKNYTQEIKTTRVHIIHFSTLPFFYMCRGFENARLRVCEGRENFRVLSAWSGCWYKSREFP